LIAILEDITERKHAEEALRREKTFSDSLINTLPGIFYLFDENGNLLRWNDNFARLTGFSNGSRERSLQFIAEEDRETVFKTAREMAQNGFGATEAQLLTREGAKIPFFLTGLRFRSNETSYLIGTGIDISERKEYEEQIKYSLKEKETLLSEIHHRVKNNLAVVSALLELQARNVDDDTTFNTLQQAQSRIKSMAMVHKQLYQSTSLSDIKMDEYIEQLSNTIKSTFINKELEIEIDRHVEPVSLNIKQAIPCGLILNELIINSFKHAFEPGDDGRIAIYMGQENESKVVMQVKDNGKGLPENFAIEEQESLGMKLVQTLSRQLHADLTIRNEQGTHFTVEFDIGGAS